MLVSNCNWCFLWTCLLSLISCQLYLGITPANSEINVATSYKFDITTSRANIPAGSIFRISFPSQYAPSATGITCTKIYWTGAPNQLQCSYSGNQLLVEQGFPADLSNEYSYQFEVVGLVNPIPAGTTGSFTLALLFLNGSSQISTGSYTVTLTEGAASCSKTLFNGLVSAIGIVNINFTPKNSLSNLTLSVSMAKSYPNDTTNTDIAASVAGGTQTGTYRFTLPNTNSFNLTLLMPSSTQPTNNFIRVTSLYEGGNIDTCLISIDNVSPNNFSAITISTGRVQSLSNIVITFINLSPLYQTDQLVVIFPSDFILTSMGSTASFIRGIIGNRNITVLNNVITIYNVTTTTLIRTNTTFVLSNITLPYSSKQLQVTLYSQTNTAFQKDTSTTNFTAQMGAISAATVQCSTVQLGYNSSCLFSFTMQSALNSSGLITIAFPGSFPLYDGFEQCLTTGTSNVRSSCTTLSQNNSIVISGMSNIANTVSVRLSLKLPEQPGIFNLNISSWCPAIVDTGSASVTVTARKLLQYQFSVQMTSKVTYSSTSYIFSLSLPLTTTNELTAIVSIPVDPSGVLSCNAGTIICSFTKPTLSVTLPANSQQLNINVTGLKSPISTQPITVSMVISRNSITYFSSNNLTVQATEAKTFSRIEVNQSSTVVYDNTTLTIILSALRNGIIRIRGTDYRNKCQAVSNITSITCTATTNGVDLNVTTDGIDNSESRTYVMNVTVVAPPFVGNLSLNITTYDISGIYTHQTGLVAITATTPNKLTIEMNQTNPYFRQNSTYSFRVNGWTPNSTFLSILVPLDYTFVSAVGLSGCTFMQNDNNLLIFSLMSVSDIRLQLILTNPSAFYSLEFKSYSNRGDIDVGSVIPVVPCGNNCRSCNGTTCLTCYSWSSYNKLDNGSCLSVCPDGKYFNSVNCANCVDGCTNCSAANNCFGCQVGRLLFNNTCPTACPNGYFAADGSCQACPSRCTTCTSLTNCTACTSNFNLLNNSCVTACPSGTYPLNNICHNCSAGCINCTYLGCEICNSTMLLYNGKCLLECPNGLYVDQNRNCTNCQAPCKTCQNSSTSCLSCQPLTYLLASSCLTACPNNYYADVSAVCLQCRSPCLNCASQNVCLSCVPSMFLYQQACLAACPDGTYMNSSTQCRACQSPCLTCTDEKNCTSCTGGLLLYNLTCEVTCPSLFYNSSGICTKCISPCLDCQSATICLSCRTGFLYNRSCVSVCPTTHYPSGNVCQVCQSPCKFCSQNGTNCLGCIDGYNLLGNQCVATCPLTYYHESQNCLKCVSPCVTCASATKCLTCNTSSDKPYFQASQCVSVCSGGLHPNPQALVCEQCQSPCLTCTTSKQCLSCVSDFMFINGSCVNTCPSGTYRLANLCENCPTNCNTCQIQNTSVVCLTCQSDRYHFGTSCVEQCPDNTTLVVDRCISKQCIVDNCVTCSGVTCLACSAYYKLNEVNNTCQLNISPSEVVNSISIGNIIPFCFLAAGILLIIVLSAVKAQFKQMYLPVGLLALLGPLEAGAIVLWFTFAIKEQFIVATVLLALYLVTNLVNLLAYIKIRLDRKYKLWLLDNHWSNIIIMTLSAIVSWRLSRLQFSKIAGWTPFTARLSHNSSYIGYHILSGLSLLYISIFGIVLCCWMSYRQTSMNQLFFSSLEVALIELMMVGVTLAQIFKPKDYLMEQAKEYIHGNDNESVKVEGMKATGEVSYNMVDQLNSRLSENFISEKEESGDIDVEEDEGCQAVPHRQRSWKDETQNIIYEEQSPEKQQGSVSIRRSDIYNKEKSMGRNSGSSDSDRDNNDKRTPSPVSQRTNKSKKSLTPNKQSPRKSQKGSPNSSPHGSPPNSSRSKSNLTKSQARLQNYETQLQKKSIQQQQLKQRLKQLQEEEDQQRRSSFKQRWQWQMMDIQDHLSRERQFRDSMRNQQTTMQSFQKSDQIKQLSLIKSEKSQPNKKKRNNSRQIRDNSIVSLDNENSKTQNSKQSFIMHLDDQSEKVTKISELNHNRTNSNLKTIQEEARYIRENDDQRFNKAKVQKMLEEAQQKANQYLNSLPTNDFDTIGSEDFSQRIHHDKSMPLPSGKQKAFSTKSFEVTKGMTATEQHEVRPIEEEEGQHGNTYILDENEDFRNSIGLLMTKRKDLPISRIEVRPRQSQNLSPSARQLELQKIYLQRLSIERSPKKESRRYSPHHTSASFRQSRDGFNN